MVGEESRSVLNNSSVALTLVRSASSSLVAGTSDDTDDANAAGTANVSLSPLRDTETDGLSSRKLCNVQPRPRYPKQVRDASTNSIYQLYQRRSSALVYGSSTYISLNPSVDMLPHRFEPLVALDPADDKTCHSSPLHDVLRRDVAADGYASSVTSCTAGGAEAGVEVVVNGDVRLEVQGAVPAVGHEEAPLNEEGPRRGVKQQRSEPYSSEECESGANRSAPYGTVL
ncbi:hypothetical protein DQ04_05901020 [Trypanosoma grayi]|uniref:hypothetical protein n=1 Tax=Trypanosoma grayi TaxID=71804 RepID=UPI0004F423A9|nr:hypothetical protein DQ04_05901020 [Trypanosoma grayi]KEG09061.1 hypothetical protein DQ04_05901020 [Trypanosoma grayi]